ncbi:MAG: hypothetical protein DHS20C14_16210 [Phycisphaeraceae bacterium]|nr:MAG: hypothetical protein DHS20C14_16210 [Phycisphaeraceae bacterium]
MLRETMAVGLVAMLAGSALADARMFSWTRPDASVGYTDDGGRALAALTTYDLVTQDLSWQMSWDDTISQGMTIVLSPGEYPSDAGRFAVMFIDYTNTADIKANIFEYNASNDAKTSIIDGTDHIAGNQAPVKILSTESGDTSWFQGAMVTDIAGKRTLDFNINTTLINAHVPVYEGRFGPVDWLGMGYGNDLGVWAHSYGGLTTNYGGDGFLDQWDADLEGFFDGTLIPTEDFIPAPGTVALLAFAGVGVTRRRR